MLIQPVLSPKDQFQLVGLPVEVSLNRTVKGAIPELISEVKLAFGGNEENTVI
mgnify:CR=1 FL=1